jgi:putative flippase GtrA
MPLIPLTLDAIKRPELVLIGRYIINGLVATGVHFGVLTFNLQILHIPSAGLANFFAATVGIATSFFGSRYFVFCRAEENIWHQASKFVLLYALIAGVNALVLFIWSDMLRFDYRNGFIIATILQLILSYIGNKILVFKHEIV